MTRRPPRRTTLSPARTRSRRRSVGAVSAGALALGILTVPAAVIDATPAYAADALSCDAIYAIDANSGAGATLWSIDASTGSQTTVGSIDPDADPDSVFNALGVATTPEHPDGAAFAMRSDPWPINRGGFAAYDFATGSTTSTEVSGLPSGWGSTQTHGAADPSSERFFHGAYNAGRLQLDVRDLHSGVREGRLDVNLSRDPAPGFNGDIAFDRDGNLYIVMSSANDANIYLLDARDITLSATAPYPAPRPRLIQSFTVADTGGLGVNGIAFDRDGFLVVSTGIELLRVNPMSGTVTSTVSFSEPGVVDIASCAYPSRVTLQKDFPQGRESADDADQVRLTVSGGGLPDLSAETTGTDVGIQHERVTVPVLPGATISIDETGTATDPDRYDAAWDCIDEDTGNTIASGAGTEGAVTVPTTGVNGANILCTFTNTPRGDAAIALIKTADVSLADLGDQVTYSFEVTNTGTTTLTDVVVDETAFTGSGTPPEITCPSSPLALAAGESVTCTGTYTIEQADVDRGSVDNTATATGTPPNGEAVVSPPSSAIVTSPQNPGLTVVKSTDATAYWTGDVIDYAFLVTNTGNVTLTDVRVDETAFTGHGPLPSAVCPEEAAALAPGQSMTCWATYEVDDADLILSEIENTAEAVGTAPTDEPVVSSPSTVTTPRGDVDDLTEEVVTDGTTTDGTTTDTEAETAPGALADTGGDSAFPLAAAGAALALLMLGTALVLVRRFAGSASA